jgi:hypothetical protein
MKTTLAAVGAPFTGRVPGVLWAVFPDSAPPKIREQTVFPLRGLAGLGCESSKEEGQRECPRFSRAQAVDFFRLLGRGAFLSPCFLWRGDGFYEQKAMHWRVEGHTEGWLCCSRACVSDTKTAVLDTKTSNRAGQLPAQAGVKHPLERILVAVANNQSEKRVKKVRCCGHRPGDPTGASCEETSRRGFPSGAHTRTSYG